METIYNVETKNAFYSSASLTRPAMLVYNKVKCGMGCVIRDGNTYFQDVRLWRSIKTIGF